MRTGRLAKAACVLVAVLLLGSCGAADDAAPSASAVAEPTATESAPGGTATETAPVPLEALDSVVVFTATRGFRHDSIEPAAEALR